MKKILCVVLAAVMMGFCFVGCSSKKDDSDDTVVETAESTPQYYERYKVWDASRTAYALGEGAIVQDSYFNGVTGTGESYTARFIVAGDTAGETYYSAEVAVDKGNGGSTHYEYFDVGDDLMFLAVTDTVDNGDGTISFDIKKYCIIDGTTNLLVDDSAQVATYSEAATTGAPFECKTFGEVIDTYAK